MIRAAAASILLACAAQPAAAEPTEWRQVDGSIRQIADLPGLEQLARDIPYSASIRLRLLNAYLEADRLDAALGEIEFLTSRGYTFSAAGETGLLGLYEGAARDRLQEAFAAKRPPLERSEHLATTPAEALLVESAALDPVSGRLFFTTIVSRGLYTFTTDGRWSEVPLARKGSFAGLALDGAQRTLWIGSGSYEESPPADATFRGLIGLDLDSGAERYVPAPEGATASDIALGDDGTLYASDPVGGGVYRARPGDTALSELVAPGTFRSPQGLVPWRGGVIVADYGYGLAFVDAAGKAWRIEADVPALLDGIDAMVRRSDTIIAVQNGARPARIVELAISADGRRITGLRELERANRAWTEPVGGTISGDDLIYVGTGQWGSFGAGGELREGATAQPTEIRRLSLVESPAPRP